MSTSYINSLISNDNTSSINETHNDLKIIRHIWTIDNFTKRLNEVQQGDKISSDIFYGEKGAKFSIVAYLNGKKELFKDHISLFLWFHGPNSKIKIQCFAHILKAPIFRTFVYILDQNSGHGWGKFERHSDLYSKIKNDKLTIICEIKILKNDYKVKRNFISNFTDFGQFFGQSKYSDFTIRVGDESLKVHKIILATQSPVFEAMFENNMKESKDNYVIIKDFDIDLIKSMVEFMYTGKCDNLVEIASKLLIAADKYQIKDLKDVCEYKLSETLCVKNAITRLVLADTYNAEELKMSVLKYMKWHMKDITELPEWMTTEIPDYLLKNIIKSLIA